MGMRTTRILKRMSAAVAILTATVAVVLFALQGQTNAVAESPVVPPADTTTTTVPSAPPPTTGPPPTLAPPTSVTPPTTVTPEPDPESEPGSVAGSLRPGDKGAEVRALQERLRHLGYWLGTPDGTYGGLTVQAVMAFQKVEGLERDGIVGPGTAAALQQAGRPQAASTGGDLIEVDKARQVLFVVRGGNVEWVLNVSTGTEETYWVNGRTELADTPEGDWQVAWVHDGVDVGELGGLYRPRYFHRDGIAVHGYHDVPAYPASHGCVRVSNQAMDLIWSEGLMPVGSPVWVY
jgi:peptidoglycan hydrolase-like protein with peptidoglycan-binding domain